MSAMSAKTANAMTSVSHLKAWSPKCCPALFFVFPFTFSLVPKIKRTKSGRNCALRPAHAHKLSGGAAMSLFNFVEHRQLALHDAVGQWSIIKRGRNFLAVGDRPFQKA